MIGGAGYGPPRRDAEGTRLSPLLNGVCAAVVAGSEPATAVAVAVGAARVQCDTRRVAVADLVGDAPLILRLLPDDDPHGISDSFLYGVSFNKIARPVEGEDQLYLIPSGSEAVTTEEIYASERWRRLAAGFHQVGALLLVVARPEVPGFAALCTHIGAVLPVGELPVDVPAGVTVLRAAPEPAAAPPAAASPWESLLAAAATSPPSGAGGATRPLGRGGVADAPGDEEDDADAEREPRPGLKVDAGLVRPKTSGHVGDEAELLDAKPRWWRSPRTAMAVALVLAGVTLTVAFPGWTDVVTAPFDSVRALFAGKRAAPDSAASPAASSAASTTASTGAAPTAAEAGAAAATEPPPAPPAAGALALADSAGGTPVSGAASSGAPSGASSTATPAAAAASARPTPSPAPAPPAPVTPPKTPTAPAAPVVPAVPKAPVPTAPARPAPATPATTPATTPTPPPAPAPRAAMVVANPQDAAQAARYSLYVATSNTREGALPDPRLGAGNALALSPVVDAGTRWYRLTVGAEPTAGDAVALLGRLRAKDPTVSGSVVSLPYALLMERGVPAGQVPARLAALSGRGVFVYALRQPDGTGAVYTGAFESPDQARTLADSLRAAGLAPTLVFRTGRAF
ncbi:MAG: hypothetical protein KJT01_14905 [Gemmatimonadetes bacterium]|nr:hypothetical protein [Gemmatimonadota bacterium]